MSKNLYLVSLGCNKNLVDSEVMLGKLKNYTIINEPENADVLIVNTCGFIGPAKEESLDTIFSLHELRRKESLLVVTGCLTERYREELQEELKEVDLFTGVGDYDKIDEIINKKESRFTPATYLLNDEERVITGSNSHAYIKLSEGCNQSCSFCAIPNFKGKLHSRTLESIEKEVTNLVKKGFYDFSFISQDSSSFMRDLGEKEGLIKLIKTIENIEGVKSARILYLYPTTTSDALIQAIINSKTFHNYFDMPIQHISNMMLKTMKRGAGKARITEQLTMMRKAENSFLRTGLIVGHPKESEKEFNELLDFVTDFDFDRVSLFPYSDEEDTAAYEMDEKIEEDIINERIEKIEEIVKQKHEKSLQVEIGKTLHVVCEGPSSEHEFFMGAKKLLWAPEIDGEILLNDSEVGELEVGKCYEAKVSELAGDKLVATVTKTIS
ncbi:30S ribosomal protein S12 methylthiotransferase RimO [Sulfurospirillum arcachonense]|uniref:30S ribosomal protein S12 methylthiotransferase RimO n=1 Tax=Sulfurospirillum arcachonense TaxID=57666 RepID=UPI00046856D1|nr:30S ribosomal protein S12 methylthiotransferase RimO [Sulfurospirillum arcachonense]